MIGGFNRTDHNYTESKTDLTERLTTHTQIFYENYFIQILKLELFFYIQ